MCASSSDWAGSRWWRFDFHTHTPASSDYGKGPEQSTCTISPQKWLLDFMRAEIDCVAVTDHNSGDWVDDLKAALDELRQENHADYRPLTLFPGVEISVHNSVHLLAIFAPNCTTSDIDSLLGAVGFNGSKGDCSSVTSKPLPEVAKIITDRGGIAIPAHVDGPNGLFGAFNGPTLKQIVACESIFAMEVVEASYDPPEIYRSQKLNWARVRGSDSHHPKGSLGTSYPGSHFTWVKMETPTLDGLRLALLDGDRGWSTKRSDVTDHNPNLHADLFIESLEVRDARYLGRGAPFVARLSPWLTTIIGGRGTGKSTLVEFLRLVMRREDELPSPLSSDFRKYRTVYRSRHDDGLLTPETQLRVVYRKDGVRFRIQWNQPGDLDAIEEETAAGGWKVAEGSVHRRFPVRIYSQKQIYHLASRPSALLEVIDDAPQVQFAQWKDEWDRLTKRYLSLCAKARELAVSSGEESALRGDLADTKRRLSIFEDAGHADVLRAYQRGQREKRAVKSWEESWASATEKIHAVAEDLSPTPLKLPAQDASTAGLALERIGEDTRREIDAVRATLQGAANDLKKIRAGWVAARQNSEWMTAFRKAEEDYRNLRQRLETEGEQDPAAYGQLVQARQQFEQRLENLNQQRVQAEKTKQLAAEVLLEITKLRRELTNRRQEFLSTVLADNEYIQINVVPFGAEDTAEQEVRALLAREGDQAFGKDIGEPRRGGLLGELYPHDDTESQRSLPRVDLDTEQRLGNFKATLKSIASGQAAPQDTRFAKHLEALEAERFDRLDTWFPKDSVQVQYRQTAKDRFRSIEEGSPGQKTSVLLAFLLSYGAEPLILDQPEDDLDNQLIYDLIVAQLRAMKSRRQVIVVTHNPNIVVNGDAELVIALAPTNGQTSIESVGSLQSREVRDVICRIMEGGRHAFDRRYQRIALEMDRG